MTVQELDLTEASRALEGGHGISLKVVHGVLVGFLCYEETL